MLLVIVWKLWYLTFRVIVLPLSSFSFRCSSILLAVFSKNDKISVLVDSGEVANEIDLDRAQSAMERAKERLSKKRDTDDIDFIRAEAALKRAISRVKVAKKIG